MFLRGRKWITMKKKTLNIISCISYCFLCLTFVLSFACANASAIAPSNYQVYFNIYGYNNNQYFWGPEINEDEEFLVWKMSRYQWKINNIAFNGNYATVHFETNLVLPDAGRVNSGWFSKNGLDSMYIRFCGTGGQNGRIVSQSVSHTRTVWYPDSSHFNITETIYGDAVISGLQYSSGSHDFYCGVATQTDDPIVTAPTSTTQILYFEQSPTSITFTTNEADAIARSQVNSLNNINNSITYLDDNEQERWETERREQAEKEQQLEDDSDNLGVSASVTPNPFTSLFFQNPYNANSCVTTGYLHQLFNTSSWTICSPYPSALRYILIFVNSLLISGLLIRLYYKTMKGGMN